jgi:hypothetical protein
LSACALADVDRQGREADNADAAEVDPDSFELEPLVRGELDLSSRDPIIRVGHIAGREGSVSQRACVLVQVIEHIIGRQSPLSLLKQDIA